MIKTQITNKEIYLLNSSDRTPLPLKHITFEVEILFSQANITIKQEYFNQRSEPINAIFVFPIESGNSLSRLTMNSDDEQLHTQIEEMEQAYIEFNDATYDKGEITAMGSYQRDSHSDDLFQISLGNIPSQKQIIITLLIHQTLIIEDMYCFRLPFRYIPRYQTVQKSKIQDFNKKQLQFFETQSNLSDQCNYTWDLSIIVQFNRDSQVEFQSNYNITEEKLQEFPNKYLIKSEQFQEMPDQDFKLWFKDSSVGSPIALVGDYQNDKGLILNMILENRNKLLKQYQKQLIEKDGYKLASGGGQSQKDQEYLNISKFNIDVCDYYFVLDRSGSMKGNSIYLSIEALKLFIYSLPFKCRFNIYSFGKYFKKLFPTIVEYNDQTQDIAIQSVQNYKADLGTTQLLDPIENIYQEIIQNDRAAQIFLITDGCIDNEENVINLIKKFPKPRTRIHTFGLGSGVSSSLIKNAALMGGGMSYLLDKVSEIEKYVIKALEFTTLPYLVIQEIQIEGQDSIFIEQEMDIQIKNGGFLIHKIFLKNFQDQIKYVILKIFDPNTFKTLIKKIEPITSKVINDNIMACVVANELKDPKYTKREIIKLSQKHQVISKYTCFFGRISKTKSLARSQLINIQNHQMIKNKKIDDNITKWKIIVQIECFTTRKLEFFVTLNMIVENLKLQICRYLQDQENHQNYYLITENNQRLKEEFCLSYYFKNNQLQLYLKTQTAGAGLNFQFYTLMSEKINYIIKDLEITVNDIISDLSKILNYTSFRIFYMLDDKKIFLENFNQKFIELYKQVGVTKLIISEYIIVEIQNLNKQKYEMIINYHKNLSVQQLMEQIGLNIYQIQIYVNNKVFKGELSQTLKVIGIYPKSQVQIIHIQSFKQVIYLQYADGHWDERLVTQYLGLDSTEKWIRNQIIQWKSEIIYTLLGLYLLEHEYPNNQQLWSMTKRKAFLFLQEQDLTKEVICEQIKEIVV